MISSSSPVLAACTSPAVDSCACTALPIRAAETHAKVIPNAAWPRLLSMLPPGVLESVRVDLGSMRLFPDGGVRGSPTRRLRAKVFADVRNLLVRQVIELRHPRVGRGATLHNGGEGIGGDGNARHAQIRCVTPCYGRDTMTRGTSPIDGRSALYLVVVGSIVWVVNGMHLEGCSRRQLTGTVEHEREHTPRLMPVIRVVFVGGSAIRRQAGGHP